jgi:antitoxin MazE
MIKKLVKHGNSWALIIDRPILELLNIDPEAPLEVSTDGQKLVIFPSKESEKKKRIDKAFARMINDYGETFKKLAE